jgi:hypothetical protein
MAEAPKSILKTCEVTRENKLQHVSPHVNIARTFFGTAATNCTAERSFSALRRTKTYLQYGMLEDQLKAFAMLNTEGEFVITIECQDVIDSFVTQHVEKCCEVTTFIHPTNT